MPDKTSFKVEGLDIVPKLLKALGDEFAPKVLKAEMLEDVKLIRDAAARLAPVDSGRLSHMIGRSSGIRNGQVFVKVGAILLSKKTIARNLQRKAEGKLKGTVLTQSPYWDRFVERGTRFQKAQPFLRPAFDENAEAFVYKVRDGMAARVEKFAAKQAKKKQ